MATKTAAPSKSRPDHDSKKKENKRARIIIRNLSFKATEEAVTNWFAKYGDIQDVKLLRKPSGDLVGCAFVQYSKVPCAARAIKECNAKPFLGRPIAIDWAIPKQQYAAQSSTEKGTPANQELESPKDVQNILTVEENGENSEEDEGDASDDEEADSDEEEEADADESDDSEGIDEEESDDETNETKKKSGSEKWKGDDSTVPDRKSDVDEGKTVFIRNLDFSTTEDTLKNYMTTFGNIHYALLCMDKVMERPKGTAFVKFQDADSALKCIEASKSSSLRVDGRMLDAVFAISRQDLDREKLEKTKEQKDNRNLYLAREGMIRPGTRAAQGVSATDMAKRNQNELWKKQMLRNLHMFISRERLCVHNLPPQLSDKQLKRLFAKHAPKGAKIVEARVMRDLKKVVDGNVHPSKGYGFVTFIKHEDALQALRNINNNPTLFTADRRPIVEFSVENRAALKAKLQRTQRSKEKSQTSQTDIPSTSSNKVKPKVAIDQPVPEFSGATADPKIKGLPSHSGPKIRHRKRNQQPGDESSLAKKPKITRKMFKNPEKRKPTAKKLTGEPPIKKKKAALKKGKKGPTRFDAMVHEYQKGYASSSAPDKKKWFDS